MVFIRLVTFLLAGYGTYLILTEFVILPSRRVEKLYRSGGAAKKKNWMERLSDPLAAKLEPFLILNAYKEEKLGHTLRTVGDPHSARQYTASAIAQALIVGMMGLMLLILHPLLPLVGLGMAGYSYINTMKEPDKLLKAKRERIELELPRFASTISNSLTASRDVVKILERYRKVCGEELAGELDVTLADMKTGNLQNALRNFEGRLGSAKLSELIRGLLSVLRGEDQVLYFQIKNNEFRREYMELQKQEIQRRPEKLGGYVAAIMCCFALMLIYVLGSQIVAGKNLLF